MAKEDRRNLCFEVRHFRLVNCHAVWLKDSSCNYFPLKCRNVCKKYFEQSSQKCYLEFQIFFSCALVSSVVSSIWKTRTRKKSDQNAFQAKGEEAISIQDKNEKIRQFCGLFYFFGYSAQKLLVLLNICVAHRNALLELE